jgi:hypothetical protein
MKLLNGPDILCIATGRTHEEDKNDEPKDGMTLAAAQLIATGAMLEGSVVASGPNGNDRS